MPLQTPEVEFLDRLSQAQGLGKLFREREAKRRRLVDETIGGLSDDDKAEIRKAMSIEINTKDGKQQLMHKDGQQKSFEMDEANRIVDLDQQTVTKIQKAFSKIVGMKEKLASAVDESGKPLFKASDIVNEIWQPLVREGLIPDTIVSNKNSKTYQYLKAAFESYQDAMKEAREEERDKDAKVDVNARGGGTAGDRLSGIGGLLGRAATSFTETAIDKVPLVGRIPGNETTEDKKRTLGLAAKTGMAAFRMETAISSCVKLGDGSGIKSATKALTQGPIQESQSSALKESLGKNLGKILGKERGESIASGLSPVLSGITDIENSGAPTYVSKSVSELSGTISLVKDTITKSIDINASEEIMDAVDKSYREVGIAKAAGVLVDKIDGLLEAALAKAHPAAGQAAAGAYSQCVDPSEIASLATEDKTPNGAGIIAALAKGFEDAMALVAPTPGDADFLNVGRAMSNAFKSGADAKAIVKAAAPKGGEEDTSKVFDSLLKPAAKAAAQAVGVPDEDGTSSPSEDPTATTGLKRKLDRADVRKAMAEKVSARENAESDTALDEVESEMLEYENRLTLVDGKVKAGEADILKLTAALERDRQICELVGSLGSSLAKTAGAGVAIAGKATETATKAITETSIILVQEVVPGLKAAKLIIQLSVNIYQAAKRFELALKFRGEAEKAMNAGSPLAPAVKNFYQAKKEQITFHMIEDAMLAIQFAGAVCEMAMHPIPLAVGKAVSALGVAGQASNSAAQEIYSEVMLRKAWAATKAAFANRNNRKLGLNALEVNPTLAMHAVSWAAKSEQDPIAKRFLNACGLNERTLATDTATQKSIREYLETLLPEDRQLKDDEKLGGDWVPSTIELTRKWWVNAKNRAATKALPKLRPDDTSGVENALRDIQSDYDKLGKLLKAESLPDKLRLGLATIDHAEITSAIDHANALLDALNKFTPYDEKGASHDEMEGLLLKVVQAADTRRLDFTRLLGEAQTARF
jgi:hypothetical protein